MRSIVAHRQDCMLSAEVIGTFGGIEGVVFGGVFFAVSQGGVNAALRGAGVATHRMHLGNDGDVGTELSRFDGSTHTGEAATNDDDVVLDHVDLSRVLKRLWSLYTTSPRWTPRPQ